MSKECMECPECHVWPNLHVRDGKVIVYCRHCDRQVSGLDSKQTKAKWNEMIEAELYEGM